MLSLLTFFVTQGLIPEALSLSKGKVGPHSVVVWRESKRQGGPSHHTDLFQNPDQPGALVSQGSRLTSGCGGEGVISLRELGFPSQLVWKAYT